MANNPKRLIWKYLTVLLFLSGLLVTVYGTTPERIGPFGITVFFMIVLGFIVSILELLTRLFLPTKRNPVIIWVISILSTGYLMLHTVEVALGDSVLILILLALFSFYWTRLYKRTP